jgi:hypothetical protein
MRGTGGRASTANAAYFARLPIQPSNPPTTSFLSEKPSAANTIAHDAVLQICPMVTSELLPMCSSPSSRESHHHWNVTPSLQRAAAASLSRPWLIMHLENPP